MNQEFHSLLKKLKVSLLSDDELAALHQLQKQWKHWEAREHQHAPLRIAEEQRATYAAFLDNPTAENEQRLMVLADSNLTGTRYALLRRAFAELRGRIGAQAAAILRPTIDRVLAALNTEHEQRLATAEPVMSSKNRNPIVIETRTAIEEADRICSAIFDAANGRSTRAPLDIAYGLILTPANVDTKARV